MRKGGLSVLLILNMARHIINKAGLVQDDAEDSFWHGFGEITNTMEIFFYYWDFQFMASCA